MTTLAQTEARKEALRRAEQGGSVSNYGPIYEGFTARGIPEDEILPRENVFTYNAWLAKGRQVRRGEKGIKIETFVPAKSGEGEEEKRFKIRRHVTVFHISQTDSTAERGVQ